MKGDEKMGRTSKKATESIQLEPLPATHSQEEREIRCVGLAMDVAEQQLRNGTASSQVICHFLKLGTIKEQEEVEKLRRENDLLEAKRKAYESAEDIKALYGEAIDAMKIYSGSL